MSALIKGLARERGVGVHSWITSRWRLRLTSQNRLPGFELTCDYGIVSVLGFIPLALCQFDPYDSDGSIWARTPIPKGHLPTVDAFWPTQRLM